MPTIDQLIDGWADNLLAGWDTRIGERFYNFPACVITSISLWLGVTAGLTGTLYVRVRDMADNILGTLGSVDVATLPIFGGPFDPTSGYTTFNSGTALIPSIQDIRICAEFNGGGIGNVVTILLYTAALGWDPYPNGAYTEYDSSWTDFHHWGLTWKALTYFIIVLPTVETDPATAIATVSAILNGKLDDDGLQACDCGFQWGLTDAYGNTTATQSKVTGESFIQGIGGLSPGTVYHFQAFATNSIGTGYGADLTFVTYLPSSPSTTVIVSSPPIILIPKRKMTQMDTTQPKILNPQVNSFSQLNIGLAKITTAMIQDLAVTNGKIDSLAVDKLTTGILSAINILLTGSLRTAVSPNSRIEISGSSIAGYSDATTKQFELRANDGKGYFGAGACYLDAIGLHLTESTKGQVTFTVASYYTGDGAIVARQITTGFKCKFVWVQRVGGIDAFSLSDVGGGYGHFYALAAGPAHDYKTYIHLHSTDGFVIGDGDNYMNTLGQQFNYIAFG